MCIKNICSQNQLPVQPLHHHGQGQRAAKGCQGQDYRPVQGWKELRDHQQEAWWEDENY